MAPVTNKVAVRFITRAQICGQRKGQGVCSAGDLRADQCALCVEVVRIGVLETLSSDIVVSVSRRPGEACLSDMRLLHGADHLHLADFGVSVNFVKTGP